MFTLTALFLLAGVKAACVAEIGPRCIARAEIVGNDSTDKRAEQFRLDKLITLATVEFAVGDMKLEPSAAEIEAAMPNVDVAAIAKRMSVLADALLRRRRGESDEAVLTRLLAPNGLTLADVENFSKQFPSPDLLEKFLAQDNAALMLRGLREQTRNRLILQKLRAIVADATRAERISEEAAGQRLWSDLLRRAGVRLHDTTYELPSGKGVIY